MTKKKLIYSISTIVVVLLLFLGYTLSKNYSNFGKNIYETKELAYENFNNEHKTFGYIDTHKFNYKDDDFYLVFYGKKEGLAVKALKTTKKSEKFLWIKKDGYVIESSAGFIFGEKNNSVRAWGFEFGKKFWISIGNPNDRLEPSVKFKNYNTIEKGNKNLNGIEVKFEVFEIK